MIFYRSVISILAIMFCSFCAVAQDNNYVYQDTAILQKDSIEAARAIELTREQEGNIDEEETDDFDEYVADTVLKYNQLAINPDSIRNLKNSRSFDYAKNLDSLLLAYQQAHEKEDERPRSRSLLERFFLSVLTKYFFWMMAVVFIAFVLYKLFFTEGFFQRSYAKSNVTRMDDESNELSKNADYAKLVALAVSKGNYRLAVRYHYLQTLQKLALKGLIQFASDKTNYEYVRELSGKSFKNEFASLTLNYEYVWYGEFEVDEIIFNTIQNKFKQFNNEV